MKARHLLIPAVVAVFAAFGPNERVAPTRWAFLVGISDYEHFGDEVGGDLPGAANDARNLRDVLVARWGFAEENIRLLLDTDATRDAIRAGLTEWLPSVVRPGDLVVFFYAGHGSQTWDLDGDEEDGLDETICPTNVMQGNTDHDITDDELGDWLDALPTDNVTVILDSCHSGTATRALTPFARPRALKRDVAADVPRPRGVGGEARATGRETDAMDAASDPDVLEIAAAQADQVAVDAAWPQENGRPPTYGGAFTTNLVKNLWQVPLETSYEEIFRRTVQDLKRQRFAQTPRISPGHQRSMMPAFTVAGPPAFAVAPEPDAGQAAVPVLSLPEPDRVVLGGGSAAGITAGSLFRVGGATLRITDVMPDRAHAVLQETGTENGSAAVRDTLAVGAQARLVAYRYPEARFQVSVAALGGAARAALRDALADTPGLELVTEPDAFAHLLLRPRDGGYAVLGMDGAVRQSVRAASPAAGARALAPLLRKELGSHRLAALENPAHPFPLEFSLSGGTSELRVGEPIEFRVRSGRDGYLTIVDLGTDGTVTVIFPNALDGDNRVQADREIVVPTPRMRTEFRAVEPVGRGIVRAFVTERPLVLSFAQGDVAAADAVARALHTAVTARGAPADGPMPVDTWATASVVYRITR